MSAFWDPTLGGKCLPTRTPYLISGSLNTFTDFYVFLLPIKSVWNLQLPRRQKIGLLVVFAGGLVFVPFPPPSQSVTDTIAQCLHRRRRENSLPRSGFQPLLRLHLDRHRFVDNHGGRTRPRYCLRIDPRSKSLLRAILPKTSA